MKAKNKVFFGYGEMMQKMALIIPYRNRKEHLKIFLTEFPEKIQKISPHVQYTIFIIEQAEGKLFNRGKLLNVGYTLTQELLIISAFMM